MFQEVQLVQLMPLFLPSFVKNKKIILKIIQNPLGKGVRLHQLHLVISVSSDHGGNFAPPVVCPKNSLFLWY